MTDNPTPQERQEAVNAIKRAWYQCDGEFCVTQEEIEASDRELHEALRALGVTDKEMA